jgi:hypothetical protein
MSMQSIVIFQEFGIEEKGPNELSGQWVKILFKICNNGR